MPKQRPDTEFEIRKNRRIRNTCTTGAMNELYVASDLMRRGFEVFRALSPAASCDLVAIGTPARMYRVEVKTGYIKENGDVKCGPLRGEHDLLAVVLSDGVIDYEPPIED